MGSSVMPASISLHWQVTVSINLNINQHTAKLPGPAEKQLSRWILLDVSVREAVIRSKLIKSLFILSSDSTAPELPARWASYAAYGLLSG